MQTYAEKATALKGLLRQLETSCADLRIGADRLKEKLKSSYIRPYMAPKQKRLATNLIAASPYA